MVRLAWILGVWSTWKLLVVVCVVAPVAFVDIRRLRVEYGRSQAREMQPGERENCNDNSRGTIYILAKGV